MEKQKPVNELFCEFCKKQYKHEKRFIDHSCEKKRRWFSKDSVESRFGFLAWSRFYELNKFGKNKEFRTNYRNFIDSKFYNAFIKFGRYMIDINALEPAKFIDFVIKSNIPLDRWTQESLYEQYVRELIKKESPEDALERNILLMNEWSMQTGEEWVDFFRKINPIQAISWLKSGRISPWLLYNVDSSVDLLERCTEEQLNMIRIYAPVAVWKIKFIKYKTSCDFIRETLKKNGM